MNLFNALRGGNAGAAPAGGSNHGAIETFTENVKVVARIKRGEDYQPATAKIDEATDELSTPTKPSHQQHRALTVNADGKSLYFDHSALMQTPSRLSASSAITPMRQKMYAFDQIFDEDSSQQYLFEESILPLVNDTFNGINTTVMLYGETASGKTYTAFGTDDSIVSPPPVTTAPVGATPLRAAVSRLASSSSSSAAAAGAAGATTVIIPEDRGILPRAISALWEKIRNEQVLLIMTRLRTYQKF
jgi:Kinesin motor domain